MRPEPWLIDTHLPPVKRKCTRAHARYESRDDEDSDIYRGEVKHESTSSTDEYTTSDDETNEVEEESYSDGDADTGGYADRLERDEEHEEYDECVNPTSLDTNSVHVGE